LFIFLFKFKYWKNIKNIFSELTLSNIEASVRGQAITLIVIFLILIIISPLFSTLFYYFCISVGHLFNKHRILAAIGTYFATDFIIQILSFAIGFSFSSRMMNVYLVQYSDFEIARKALGSMNAYLGFTLLFIIALSAVFYLLASYILSKKLNLE
jgi:hypothetical protein